MRTSDTECCTHGPFGTNNSVLLLNTIEFCSKAAATTPAAPPLPLNSLNRSTGAIYAPRPLYQQRVCLYVASHTSCSHLSTRLQTLEEFSPPCDLLLNSQGSRGTEELNNCHPTADFMMLLTLFVLDFCRSHPTQSEPRQCARRPTFARTPALTGCQ